MTNTAYKGNSTDVTVELRGFTASTGMPYTNGAHNTSGITCSYIRNRGASTAISLVTQTATGAHTDGGFVHVAGGVYRLDLPDAAVATGTDDVIIQVSGVTDVVFTAVRIDILGADPRAASADANLVTINGQTTSASGTVTFPNATLASTTNITAGTVTTATNVTTVNGLASGVITATSIASDAITSAKIASDAIGASQVAADAATEIASAVLTAATSTPINANVKQMNDATLLGNGTSGNKWRG